MPVTRHPCRACTKNVIPTGTRIQSVGTKVLTPRQAIILAAVTNLVGALYGDAVAKTVTSGIIDSKLIAANVAQQTIICALLGGIVWNLVIWWLGLPSSSTHAMVGGLCGAGLGVANGNWKVLKWVEIKTKTQMVPASNELLGQLDGRALDAGTNHVAMVCPSWVSAAPNVSAL